MKWNPRYVRYAQVHCGGSPEEQLEADRLRWPGGCMCGFQLWMQDAWQKYYDTYGMAPAGKTKGPLDLPCDRSTYPHFDVFLSTYEVKEL